jgi:hypothetical protein
MAPTTASSAKAALGAASARTAIKAAKIRVSIVFSMRRGVAQPSFEVALPIVNKTLPDPF